MKEEKVNIKRKEIQETRGKNKYLRINQEGNYHHFNLA